MDLDEIARPIPVASDFETFDALYPVLRRFAGVVADIDMDPDDLVQDALAKTLDRRSMSDLENPQARQFPVSNSCRLASPSMLMTCSPFESLRNKSSGRRVSSSIRSPVIPISRWTTSGYSTELRGSTSSKMPAD